MNTEETFAILDAESVSLEDLRSLFEAHKDHIGTDDCEACNEYRDAGGDSNLFFDWVLSNKEVDSKLIQEIIDWYESEGRAKDSREMSAPFGYGQRVTYAFALGNKNCPQAVFDNYASGEWIDYWQSMDSEGHEYGVDEIMTDVKLLEGAPSLSDQLKSAFRKQVHESTILGCSGDFASCEICSKLLV